MSKTFIRVPMDLASEKLIGNSSSEGKKDENITRVQI